MIAIPALDFDSIDVDRFRQTLREAISVWTEIEQPLQYRVVEFLISGHDTEVLLDLRETLRKPECHKFFTFHEGQLQSVDWQRCPRLLKLFDQPITPPGYYQRLGQICSQHPDLDRIHYRCDSRLPKWFNDLIRFAGVLKSSALYKAKYDDLTCSCEPIFSSLNEAETEQLLRVQLEANESSNSFHRALNQLGGVGAYLSQRLGRLLPLCTPDPQLRESLIVLLSDCRVDPGTYLEQVIDWGFGISRGNRKKFQEILERHRAAARQLLLQRLTSGSPAQRTNAADWLNKIFGRAIAGELASALAKEKDRHVYSFIEQLYSVYRQAEEYERALANQLALPPVEMPAGELPLPAGFAIKFQIYLDEALEHDRQKYRTALHSHALSEEQAATQSLSRPTPPSPDDLLTLYLYIEGKSAAKPPENPWLCRVLQELPTIEKWCDPRELHLLQVMRLLDAIGSLQERSSALAVYHFALLNAHRLAQAIPYGLREIDAAAERIFGRPHLMSRGYLMEAARYTLEGNAVWPAYVDQLKLIEDSIAGVPLDQYDREVTSRRQTALAIAGILPVLPKRIEEATWSLALADGWTLRPLARPLLKQQANCLERAIAALAHRSSGARMGAAELLQELGQPEAIEPLKKALKKEKLLPVQGHLLATLDSLGANVDEFIGRDKLLEDAQKADRRPTRSMVWFPMKKIPDVRWATDDAPVARIVLEWWLLQCVRFQSTTCSPIMRRALAMCRRDDTLRLAHFILDTWIRFDTQEPDRVDLEQRVRAEATKLFSVFKMPGAGPNKSMINVEDHVKRMINEELRSIQRQQSAYPERGLLAIVAAFGDRECVEKMEAYIRNYHGNRALQAKSMLEVIPQIDDPSSLRAICSLAAGFRNATICKRAGELLSELAERHGWTKDETAERIIPDAGFALQPGVIGSSACQGPEMTLSYGRRQFRAFVNDAFEVQLFMEDGSRLRELPTATKEDDKTLARVAKAQLKTARQVVETTAAQLTERLFQAMCSQRSWKCSDWRELLAQHVLASIACRRVVWSFQPASEAASLFFLLQADATIVDLWGKPIELTDEGLVRVAHPSEMGSAIEQLWLKHLEVDGIQPLLPQTSDGLKDAIQQRD